MAAIIASLTGKTSIGERVSPRSSASVSGIQPIISSKRKGITVANAFMTDGRVVRFGIVARDPLTVRTMSSEARPGDVEAIESWLAQQGRAG